MLGHPIDVDASIPLEINVKTVPACDPEYVNVMNLPRSDGCTHLPSII